VLEENKKLRALLRERGVPEADIVAVMGGSNDKPFEHISVASSLNNMLERKIACHVSSSMDSDIESPPSMHSSSASMAPRGPAVPPIVIPQHRASTLNETPSPRSIVSSTGTPPGFSVNPFFHHASMTPEVKPRNMPQYGYQYEQPIMDISKRCTLHFSACSVLQHLLLRGRCQHHSDDAI
jgi:hypothetical protein